MSTTPAYTATTGQTPVIAEQYKTDPEVGMVTAGSEWDPEPYCFVCSRPTDHVAEHDDLVAAGQAEYQDDGTVLDLRGRRWTVSIER